MTLSPIQLVQLLFRHLRVESDLDHLPPEPPNPFVKVFVFDGINVRTDFGIVEADPDHERGRMFFATLRVIVDNQPVAEVENQRFSPYRIDVEANGLIAVLSGAEKIAPPEDLATVNGASLLWSAIREQVYSLTSRMPAGPVMLPTVHFQDLKKSTPDRSSVEPAPAAAPPAKSASKKKTKP